MGTTSVTAGYRPPVLIAALVVGVFAVNASKRVEREVDTLPTLGHVTPNNGCHGPDIRTRQLGFVILHDRPECCNGL